MSLRRDALKPKTGYSPIFLQTVPIGLSASRLLQGCSLRIQVIDREYYSAEPHSSTPFRPDYHPYLTK